MKLRQVVKQLLVIGFLVSMNGQMFAMKKVIALAVTLSSVVVAVQRAEEEQGINPAYQLDAFAQKFAQNSDCWSMELVREVICNCLSSGGQLTDLDFSSEENGLNCKLTPDHQCQSTEEQAMTKVCDCRSTGGKWNSDQQRCDNKQRHSKNSKRPKPNGRGRKGRR